MAAERGYFKIVEDLIAKGLDIDIRNGGEVRVFDSTLMSVE